MTEEAAKPPIQVLIVTGMTDVHHKWRETTPALATLLADTGRFEVHVTEEFRGAGPETLEGYDLVLLNYYGRFEPWGVGEERRFGERTERALFDFVRAGGGLIPYHATLQGGVGWEEFERVAGLVLRDHTSRRAPNNDFQVRVAAPDHPITRGWPASFPHYQDDLYVEMVRPNHVLLQGYNVDGEEVQIEADELMGRMFQHETDHLHGILMFDRMEPDQRKAALKQYRKLAEGKTDNRRFRLS